MIEIDYTKYYWKNDLIQLRQPKAEDWEELVKNKGVKTYGEND